MTGISTSIEMVDRITAPLMHMVNSMNMLNQSFMTIESTAGNTSNSLEFSGFQNELESASIAAAELQSQLDILHKSGSTPDTVMPSQPVQPTMPQWQSPQTIDVIDGSGMERYTQEINSVNDLLNQVQQNQQRIDTLGSQTDVFPDGMINDIQSLNQRIIHLKSSTENMNNTPIDNLGANQVNNDIETLRNQLNQAIRLQEELSSSMETMDVSRANRAYTQLNSTIDSAETNIRNNMNAQESFNNSIRDGGSMMDGLKGKIGAAIVAYASLRGISSVINMSDELTMTTARLNLMNDNLQNTKQLQDLIFLSAERSRASYTDTAAAVSKLGLLAGDAFKNNVEIIQFTENLNKQFVIAGTEVSGVQAAMLQLTQAMGSGVLRGEEFISIYEQAPNVIQTIADYMDVPIGKMKDLASEGAITSEIVKNAMLSATDEINAQFDPMPKTFGQIATSISNNALMAFQPILERLNDIGNSEAFDSLVNGVISSFVVLAGVVTEIFNLIASVAGFVADNWSIIEPLVIGAATALGAYVATLLIYNATQLITNGIKGAAAIAEAVHMAAVWLSSDATFAATAAQWGFNAALLACPITWIVIAIIAIIAALYAGIAAWNAFTGSSISATGIIVGAIFSAGAFIGNLFITLVNFAIDAFGVLWNFIAAFANFFGNVMNDPIGSIARLFFDLVDTVLGLLESLASAIDTIFGSDLADSVSGWRKGLNGWVDETFGKGEEVMAKFDATQYHLGRFEYGEAWDMGYSIGQDIETSIGNFDPSSLFDSNIPNPEDYANALGDSQLGNDIAGTKDNTDAIKDSLDITSEELKYLRDIAEQEAINRFTTAEIKVEMNNNNHINNEMDLDGIADYLAEKVEEKMEIAAEGVHD